jgi:hypothetical protein
MKQFSWCEGSKYFDTAKLFLRKIFVQCSEYCLPFGKGGILAGDGLPLQIDFNYMPIRALYPGLERYKPRLRDRKMQKAINIDLQGGLV